MIMTLLTLLSIASATQVKEMKLKSNEVGIVHTSIGYSTVLQLSQKPLNVVLGDQSAFRVEFINDSITIKPLRSGAKSNLFIFTDNDRFNLTIQSGATALVDYVVRIRRIFPDRQKIRILHQSLTLQKIKLNLIRATEKDSELFLDFSIQNLRSKSILIKPDNFRFSSQNFLRPIRSLYLETQNLTPGATSLGTMLMPLADFKDTSIWFTINDEKPVKFHFFKKQNLKSEANNAN